MQKLDALFGVARLPLDMLAVMAALLLSFRLREANVDLLPGIQLLEPARTLPPIGYYVSTFVVPGMFTYLLLASLLGLYTLRSTFGAWAEVGRIMVVALFWVGLVIAWYFLILKELFFSRALLLHSVLLIIFFVSLARMVLLLLQRSLLQEGIGRQTVVSVGAQALQGIANETLLSDYHYAYLGHARDLQGLQKLAPKGFIDLVLQTDPHPQSESTIALIEYCRSHHIGYGFLPPVLADVPHMLEVDRLGLLPLMRFRPTPLDGWGRIFKRLFDIAMSLLLLVVLSPMFLLLSLCVLLDSGWPLLYRSQRVGQYGRTMVPLLKFRSMIPDADTRKEELLPLNHRRDGPLFKIKNDPRVTRVGRFLRRWSLDELPQLLNVLVGHMSLVGPRPHLPVEVDRYSPEQRRVFAVKPGITGLAQVAGRSDLQFEDEVRLDLQYIEEWSILLDVWVLWRTVFVVLGRKGAD